MRMYKPPSQKKRNVLMHIFNQVCWLIYFHYLGQLQILPLRELFLNIPNFTYMCAIYQNFFSIFIHTFSQNSILVTFFNIMQNYQFPINLIL